MPNLENPRAFILAGNATFTIKNQKSGNRFTFKVTKLKDEQKDLWFVKLLNGSDNVVDYVYMGIIDSNMIFRRTSKSKISVEASSFKAFNWLWSVLGNIGELPDCIDIYHEGRCGRCGRKLTVPESIESGFGPECINKIN